METQRFSIVLATDDDVTEKELRDSLEALGYHGVLVLDHARIFSHEHPCPSSHCFDSLRDAGHLIPSSESCCYCWGVIPG